jgi:hypothetical protein
MDLFQRWTSGAGTITHRATRLSGHAACLQIGFLFLLAAALLVGAPSSARPQTTNRLPYLLACGDSLMQLPASRALPRAFEHLTPPLRVVAAISIGTGLARPDLYDWSDHLQDLLQREGPPLAAVLWFGANDDQPLRNGDGQLLPPDTPEWRTEYASRIQKLIALLHQAGTQRILWIGLPRMRDEPLQRHAERINAIGREVCARDSKAIFWDPDPILSLRADHYSPYARDARGMPIPVRASDGIHLTPAGADRISEAIREAILAAGAFQ